MPRPFGQRYVDRQSHRSVTCWPGAPVASVISANALVCDRDGGDPAGPGCDDANVARMCDYYLGGNQQQRRGQPARRRWPAPTPSLPGKSWFPQTPESSTRTCSHTPPAWPRPRSAEFSVYASLAFPVARRCSRPEPSPARCFSIASLLTPPTATPRFGLPMFSGGPGVRAGSSFRYLGPAGTPLRPASTRRRAETAETGVVRLMTQRRQPHRGSQSMITADKRPGRG